MTRVLEGATRRKQMVLTNKHSQEPEEVQLKTATVKGRDMGNSSVRRMELKEISVWTLFPNPLTPRVRHIIPSLCPLFHVPELSMGVPTVLTLGARNLTRVDYSLLDPHPVTAPTNFLPHSKSRSGTEDLHTSTLEPPSGVVSRRASPRTCRWNLG